MSITTRLCSAFALISDSHLCHCKILHLWLFGLVRDRAGLRCGQVLGGRVQLTGLRSKDTVLSAEVPGPVGSARLGSGKQGQILGGAEAPA